jgi:microcystin-dependent protein
MKRASLLSAAALAAALGVASQASAQANTPFLGQVMEAAFTFCPKNWVEANGQLIPIAQNTALFALLGTTYGGNGQTNFAIPDLRGRASVHAGKGPGLEVVDMGEQWGADGTVLTVAQMPVHTHVLHAALDAPDTNSPDHALLGTFPAANKIYVAVGPPKIDMRPTAIDNAGGGMPFDQHQPSLAMRYCVCVSGVFPSRP